METLYDNKSGPDDLIPCLVCRDWFWSIGKVWDVCNRCRNNVEV
jgi:hypothetical protein